MNNTLYTQEDRDMLSQVAGLFNFLLSKIHHVSVHDDNQDAYNEVAEYLHPEELKFFDNINMGLRFCVPVMALFVFINRVADYATANGKLLSDMTEELMEVVIVTIGYRGLILYQEAYKEYNYVPGETYLPAHAFFGQVLKMLSPGSYETDHNIALRELGSNFTHDTILIDKTVTSAVLTATLIKALNGSVCIRQEHPLRYLVNDPVLQISETRSGVVTFVDQKRNAITTFKSFKPTYDIVLSETAEQFIITRHFDPIDAKKPKVINIRKKVPIVVFQNINASLKTETLWLFQTAHLFPAFN